MNCNRKKIMIVLAFVNKPYADGLDSLPGIKSLIRFGRKVISTPSLILTGPCCFICGFGIKSGESCVLQTSPPKENDASSEKKSAGAELTKAFFPFLASWDSPLGENGGKVKEDGSVTVCRFCNDNLSRQWDIYESGGDKDRWLRSYNPRLFFCFLCGVETLRARLRRVSKDQFPFILDHTPPLPEKCLFGPKSEWAVICYTCYIALQQQFKEYEKMHLPEKFRKYNWRQIPLEQTLPLQKEERRMRKDTCDSLKEQSEIDDCTKEDSNSSLDFASERESSRMSGGTNRNWSRVDSSDSQARAAPEEYQEEAPSRGTPPLRFRTSSPCASSLSIKREVADSSAAASSSTHPSTPSSSSSHPSHGLPATASHQHHHHHHHRRSPSLTNNPQSPSWGVGGYQSPHLGPPPTSTTTSSSTMNTHHHQPSSSVQHHPPQQPQSRTMVSQHHPLAHPPPPPHPSVALAAHRPPSSHYPHHSSAFAASLPPQAVVPASSGATSGGKHPSPFLPTRSFASSSSSSSTSPSRSAHRPHQDGGPEVPEGSEVADPGSRRARINAGARPDDHSLSIRPEATLPQDMAPYVAAVWPASGYPYPNYLNLDHFSQMSQSPFAAQISSSAGRYPTELLRIQNNTAAALMMEERRKEEEKREEERRREEEKRREEEVRQERRKREEELRRIEETRRIEERRQREVEERRAMERRAEERRKEEERKKTMEAESLRQRYDYQSYYQAHAAYQSGEAAYPSPYSDSSNSGVVDLRKRLSPSHSLTPPAAHDRAHAPTRHATPSSGMELDLRVKAGEGSTRHHGTPPSSNRSRISPRDRHSPSRSRSGSRESGRHEARESRREQQQQPQQQQQQQLPPPLPPPPPHARTASRSPSATPRLHSSADSLFRPYDRAADAARLSAVDASRLFNAADARIFNAADARAHSDPRLADAAPPLQGLHHPHPHPPHQHPQHHRADSAPRDSRPPDLRGLRGEARLSSEQQHPTPQQQHLLLPHQHPQQHLPPQQQPPHPELLQQQCPELIQQQRPEFQPQHSESQHHHRHRRHGDSAQLESQEERLKRHNAPPLQQQQQQQHPQQHQQQQHPQQQQQQLLQQASPARLVVESSPIPESSHSRPRKSHHPSASSDNQSYAVDRRVVDPAAAACSSSSSSSSSALELTSTRGSHHHHPRGSHPPGVVVVDTGVSASSSAGSSSSSRSERDPATTMTTAPSRHDVVVEGAASSGLRTSSDADLVRSSLAQRVMSQMASDGKGFSASDSKGRRSEKQMSSSPQDVRRSEAESKRESIKVESSTEDESLTPLPSPVRKLSDDSVGAASVAASSRLGATAVDAAVASTSSKAETPDTRTDISANLKSPPPSVSARSPVSSLDKAQLLMAEARRLRKRRRRAQAVAAAAAEAAAAASNAASSETASTAASASGKCAGATNDDAAREAPPTQPPPPDVETEDEEEEEGEADREELEELMRELEELEEWRRVRCTMGTVWPKRFDDNEDPEEDHNKMQYVAALGLRTKRAADDARWDMRIRSKRLRREASLSPILVEEDKFDETKKGGPLWDDVSLSLLESELRGGMDLTNGISPVAPADLARVKRMGSESFMEGLGLRPKRRRPPAYPQPSQTEANNATPSPGDQQEVSQQQQHHPSSALIAGDPTSSSRLPASSNGGDAPSSASSEIVSLDADSPVDPTAATAAAPKTAAGSASGGGVVDAAASTGSGRGVAKTLFATSTRRDEKMNEFAREFHQSVLQTTRQQLGQQRSVSAAAAIVLPESPSSSQERGDVASAVDPNGDDRATTTNAADLFFPEHPPLNENWRAFFDSFTNYIKGVRLESAENIAAKATEEEERVDKLAATLKEKIRDTLIIKGC